ncbi:hypothetical protein [Bifidobacterium porcinum]|uniref:hypothetical protein n=1 Tax=Bifidobacterium porcinum TaxID=212365 RepID=UPI00399596B9
MPSLIACQTPRGLLANLKSWLESKESTTITGSLLVAVDGHDPPIGEPNTTLRAVAMSVDYQQPATPVSLYARLMVRCYVEHPDGSHSFDELQELAASVAQSISRYPVSHGDVVTAGVDTGASIQFDGGRAYAYITLLLTVPTAAGTYI